MEAVTIYYPPTGLGARWLAPLDPWPRRFTTLGAAFIAVAGRKPGGQSEPPGGPA